MGNIWEGNHAKQSGLVCSNSLVWQNLETKEFCSYIYVWGGQYGKHLISSWLSNSEDSTIKIMIQYHGGLVQYSNTNFRTWRLHISKQRFWAKYFGMMWGKSCTRVATTSSILPAQHSKWILQHKISEGWRHQICHSSHSGCVECVTISMHRGICFFSSPVYPNHNTFPYASISIKERVPKVFTFPPVSKNVPCSHKSLFLILQWLVLHY